MDLWVVIGIWEEGEVLGMGKRRDVASHAFDSLALLLAHDPLALNNKFQIKAHNGPNSYGNHTQTRIAF